mmetsp:Transcript_55950/g.130763  ORF Transcript_55950/g.130763 Transcript_55950/m.130763 type:complete len:674 (-) Transcript_55950:281-2302(-)
MLAEQLDYDDSIRCNWRFIASCYLFPMTNGFMNGYSWAGAGLYFRQNGWPLAVLGTCTMVGFSLRVAAASLYLKFGFWLCLPLALVHFACLIPALLYPEDLGCIALQLTAVAGLDMMLPNDSIVFYNYSMTEQQAQKANATTIQSLVFSYALASTLGGLLYDNFGWTGMVWFELGCQTLQVALCVTEPAVFKSFQESTGLFGGLSEDDFVYLDEDSEGRQSEADVRVSMTGPEGPEHAQIAQPTLLPGMADEAPAAPAMLAVVPSRGPTPNSPKVSPSVAPAEGAGGHCENEETEEASSGLVAVLKRGSTFSAIGFGRRSVMPAGAPSSRPGSGYDRGSGSGSGRHSSCINPNDRLNAWVRNSISGDTNPSRVSVASGMSRASHIVGGGLLRPTHVSDGERSMMFMPPPEEDAGSKKSKKNAIPKDVYLPLLLICLQGFNTNFSYHSEWCTFAIFFKEQHNWHSATWAGLAQTAGDVIGAITMKIQSRCGSDDHAGGRKRGLTWLYHSVFGKPYFFSVLVFLWVACDFVMAGPSLAPAVMAQVVMGTVYAYCQKASGAMNLFYSRGDSQLYLTFQVFRQNADSLGCAIASIASLLLYEQIGPTAPFLATGALSAFTLIMYTTLFCCRVGFGKDLEEAEELRAKRRGLKWTSSWSSRTLDLGTVQENDDDEDEE